MPLLQNGRAVLLVTAASIALLPAPLTAQTVPDTAPVTGGLLGRITYFATRLPRAVEDVPATVTVIDGDDIEAQGISDMQQLTRYVPGLTVNRQINAAQPFNDFDGFSMRGVGGNRVLMLVDGSRVAERITDGTRDYLDLNFTRQAEVVRGPGSVLWGADALGGVVALRTIDPEDVLEGRQRGGTARIGHDSFTRENNAAVTFAQRFSDNLAVLVGYSRMQAREPRLSRARENGGLYSDIHGGCLRNLDYGATPCNEFDPTRVDSERGLFKLEWRPTTEHRLTFSADAMRRRTDVQFNQVLGPVFNTLGNPTGEINHAYDRRLDIERQRYALDYSWTPANGLLDELRATVSFTPHSYARSGVRRSTSATGDNLITRDYLNYSEDFFEVDLQGTRRFAIGSTEHELIFGFDGDRAESDYERIDRVTNLTTGVETETRAGGFNFANSTTRRADLYIQDRITFAGGAFELVPGLRYATYQIDPRPNADYIPVPGLEPVRRSDSALLGSLAATWRINNQWSVWGNIGQGFKMPTAQQLYTSLPGTSFDLIPAPDLRPEHVRSAELGLRGQFAQGSMGISVYRARYTDFIQSFYNPPGTSQYTYRNIESRDVWGIEASGEWAINDRLTATGSLAFQRGTQVLTAGAARTPADLLPFSGVVGVSYAIPERNLTLDAFSRFASSASRTASDTGFRPGGYALLDLYARWDVTEMASINFGITNVFDTRYYQPSAIGVTTTPSPAVARQNPLDLHTGPGRVFTVALQTRF